MLYLLFAFVAITVRQEGTVLRNGCSSGDEQVAVLRAGDPVQIRFSLAGDAEPCYKVAVTSDGKSHQGYLTAAALDGLDQFDKTRRAGSSVGGFKPETPESKEIRERVLAVPAGGPLEKVARFIEAGQFTDALHLAESYLKLAPKDPAGLTLAGYAAYQADDVKTAKDYWGQALP